ncbi:hypothetical protein FG379_003647 [Cryptosporidium bovis]|uniref:uncharacterized protein n=1 Tax=Cryptosporidium bovis TaxID=310047 RepID=UPI00351A52F4|nr:hypothetical protein FG379_003647 [Cryptosporidium bovis]
MWCETKIGKVFRCVVDHVYLSTTCLHLLVLCYGLLQDKLNVSVKFTDIDYMVFTDAAKAVLQGKSPYSRHTYRYTPLLAYVASINIIFKMEILSKLLFCAVNILSGKILEWLLILLDVDNDLKLKGSITLRRFLISTWLLNPFPVVIAARGSADVIPSILVLVTIYFLMKAKYDNFNNKTNIVISGFFFGLSVHFKLYPVIYGFPFLFFINSNYLKKDCSFIKYIINFPIRIFTNLNIDQIIFGFVSFTTIVSLISFFYYIYGWEFLYETYLYHAIRKDHRHNFSVFFYLFYLTMYSAKEALASNFVYKVLPYIASIPQMFLVVLSGISLVKDGECIMAIFCQTVIFVAFNKVCTSQYFLWWFILLPLALRVYLTNNLAQIDESKGIIHSASTSLVPISISLGVWIVTKISWLYFAYNIEMLGQPYFLSVSLQLALLFHII